MTIVGRSAPLGCAQGAEHVTRRSECLQLIDAREEEGVWTRPDRQQAALDRKTAKKWRKVGREPEPNRGKMIGMAALVLSDPNQT